MLFTKAFDRAARRCASRSWRCIALTAACFASAAVTAAPADGADRNVAATAQASLAQLEVRVRDGTIPGIHGVVVVQHGKTVAEWYLQGDDETIGQPLGVVKFNADTLHDVRSVTKSVVSLLFGIAMADGAIKDLDAPVLDWFPEYADLRTPERLRIRVRDVLSMTSGMHWDEFTYPYSDVRNSEIAMDIAEDPHRYAISQVIDVPPGTRWTYSGGDVALVGAIVSRAVEMPLEEYARQKLFGPLGIRFEWSKNRGIPRAASGLRITPRDMAKLGQLVLNQGRWDGKQIVPAAWIADATTRKADVVGGPGRGGAYGYLWWLGSAEGVNWIGGIGNGGQRIWIVPQLDLVVAITAGLYNDPAQGAGPTEILRAVGAALR